MRSLAGRRTNITEVGSEGKHGGRGGSGSLSTSEGVVAQRCDIGTGDESLLADLDVVGDDSRDGGEFPVKQYESEKSA